MKERKKTAPRKKQPRVWGHVAHSSSNRFQFQPWQTAATLAGPGVLEVPCHLDLCCCQCVLVSFISRFLGKVRKDILACCPRIMPVTRKRKATEGDSSHMMWEPHLQCFKHLLLDLSSSRCFCASEHHGIREPSAFMLRSLPQEGKDSTRFGHYHGPIT